MKGQGKRPTIQKEEKKLEAPKKSPIEEKEGQLLGPIGTTLLAQACEKAHTHTHTYI